MNEARRVRRIILSNMPFVVVLYALGAVMNFALIGYIARSGGLALVGQWALLNAVLLVIVVLDFGMTQALTRRGAVDSAQSILPSISMLTLLGAGLIALIAAAGFLAGTSGVLADSLRTLAIPGTIAVVSGLLQLIASWWTTPLLAVHRQYVPHLLALVRVVVQFVALVVVFEGGWGRDAPLLSFSLSILAARLAEIALAFLMLIFGPIGRAAFHGLRPSPLREVRGLAAEYGLLIACIHLLDPLTRGAIGFLGTHVSVGAYAVAFRMPTMVCSLTNQAMRSLLPGIAHMNAIEDRSAVSRLVADGIAVQSAIMVPAIVFLFVNAEVILRLWLGEAASVTVSLMRAIAVSSGITTLIIPFFWALFALGGAGLMARFNVAQLVLVVLGAIVIAPLEGARLVSYIWLFSIVNIGVFTGYVLVLHSKYGMVSDVLSRKDLMIFSSSILLCFAAGYLVDLLPRLHSIDLYDLALRAVIYGLLVIPPVVLSLFAVAGLREAITRRFSRFAGR